MFDVVFAEWLLHLMVLLVDPLNHQLMLALEDVKISAAVAVAEKFVEIAVYIRVTNINKEEKKCYINNGKRTSKNECIYYVSGK